MQVGLLEGMDVSVDMRLSGVHITAVVKIRPSARSEL